MSDTEKDNLLFRPICAKRETLGNVPTWFSRCNSYNIALKLHVWPHVFTRATKPTDLQVFCGLVVAWHQQQLGPDAAQVHVAQQGHTLHCRLIGRLHIQPQDIKCKERKKICWAAPLLTTTIIVSESTIVWTWARRSRNISCDSVDAQMNIKMFKACYHNHEFAGLRAVCDATGSHGFLKLLMGAIILAPGTWEKCFS